MKKNKKLILFINVLILLGIAFGTTYAVIYSMNDSNLRITTADIDLEYQGNASFTSNDLYPIPDADKDKTPIKVAFKVKGKSKNDNIFLGYRVSLKNLNVDNALKNSNVKYELVKGYQVVSSGNLNNLSSDNIVLLSNALLPKSTLNYDELEFKLWISSTNEDQSSMMNKAISGEIGIELYLLNDKTAPLLIGNQDKSFLVSQSNFNTTSDLNVAYVGLGIDDDAVISADIPNIDLTIKGDYTVTYTVKDRNNQDVTFTRIIKVDYPEYNEPDLIEGMIPVYYDNNAQTWKKALSSRTITYNTGDVNDDGIVNGNDATLAQSIMNGSIASTTKQFYAADVNNDHLITNSDIVLINNGGLNVETTKNVDQSKWYDYDHQKWANAVLVNTDATNGVEGSKSRNDYLSSPEGTIINSNDILAFYVWIPRYKYQLFNPTFAATSSSEIQIKWEKDTNTTGTTYCEVNTIGVEECNNNTTDDWYTHPAFTFGTEQLKGIWVGKFELTGDTTIPTIKPLSVPVRSQRVSGFFTTIQKFKTTTYLPTTSVDNSQIDSHMIKNIEWGAVAYLTNSKYGRCINGTCTELGINNYYNTQYQTGCGYAAGSGTLNVCHEYTTSDGMRASTTNNITGIYDMAGGTYEYVMGNMRASTSATTINLVSAGTLNIDSKYYDAYAYNTDVNSYNNSHLGDATGETRGWYQDASNFTASTSAWFGRGARYAGGNEAGPYNFSSYSGTLADYLGSRAVLTKAN